MSLFPYINLNYEFKIIDKSFIFQWKNINFTIIYLKELRNYN